MKRDLKIAVVVGELPTTSFIQVLLDQITDHVDLILIGDIKAPYKPGFSFKLVRPAKRISQKINSLLLVIYFIMKSQLRYRLYQYLIRDRNSKFKVKVHLLIRHSRIIFANPDLIHLQWVGMLNDYMFLQDFFNIPLVCSLRGAHINYLPLVNNRVAQIYKTHFPKIYGFHAVSKDIAMRASMYNADHSSIRVIYTAIDNQKFDYIPYSKQSDNLKILSVGRPHWKKGFTYAIDGLNLLNQKGLNFKYTIIGGQKDESLIYQIHDLKLTEKIEIMPLKSQNEVVEEMYNADIFLLPSVEEGLANVVVEAMAVGTLVLSSDCCGMIEAIEHEKTGFLFKSRNIQDLADKIEFIFELNDDIKFKVKENAKELAYKKFSSNRLGNEMIKLYIQTRRNYKNSIGF